MTETRIEKLINTACSDVARSEEEACKQTLNRAYAVEEVSREKYDKAFDSLSGSTYDACNVSANNTDRLIATCLYKNFQPDYSKARQVTYGADTKKAVEHLADIKTKYRKEYAEAAKKKAAEEAKKVEIDDNAANTISRILNDAPARAKLAELVGICSSANPVSQPCLKEFKRAMTQLLRGKGSHPGGMASVLKGEEGFHFRIKNGETDISVGNVDGLESKLAEIAGGTVARKPASGSSNINGLYVAGSAIAQAASVDFWQTNTPELSNLGRFTLGGERGLQGHLNVKTLEVGWKEDSLGLALRFNWQRYKARNFRAGDTVDVNDEEVTLDDQSAQIMNDNSRGAINRTEILGIVSYSERRGDLFFGGGIGGGAILQSLEGKDYPGTGRNVVLSERSGSIFNQTMPVTRLEAFIGFDAWLRFKLSAGVTFPLPGVDIIKTVDGEGVDTNVANVDARVGVEIPVGELIKQAWDALFD